MVCILSFPSSCDLLNSPPPVCSFPYDGRNQAEQILIKAVCTWLCSAVSQQHEGRGNVEPHHSAAPTGSRGEAEAGLCW